MSISVKTKDASLAKPATAPSVQASKRTEGLDTTVSLSTPERIVFQYPLAGPFRRCLAYLLDILFLTAIVFVIWVLILAVSLGNPSGVGLLFVSYFFLTWGYGIFCEGVLNGQTLGKRVVGIRVVTEQGVPITGAQAALRNLVGTIDGLFPFFYLSGLTSMALSPKFQRLGDLAAGTIVIVEEKRLRTGVITVKEPAVDALLPWLPLRIDAGQDLSRALSDYVRRRNRFSHLLREEIASPLAAPLRKKYALPENSPSDVVLCAVYHRVFLGE